MKKYIIILFAAVAMLFSSCAVTRHGIVAPVVPVPVVVTASPYYYGGYYIVPRYRPRLYHVPTPAPPPPRHVAPRHHH